MSLFRASAEHLHARIRSGTLVDVLTEQYRHRLGRSPAEPERRSWERSLTVLAEDLDAAGLGAVEVLVEYQLPLTSNRADVVLCGTHPTTGDPSYVVVELKQWSSAVLVADTEDVVNFPGRGERLHPGEQVARYCRYLCDYVTTLEQDPDRVRGVAYLHNANDDDVEALWRRPEDEHSRLFTGQRRTAFRDHLRAHLAPMSGAAAADALQGSAVHPSKQLLTLAAAEVQQREQFVLLDQQQTAYSLVMRAVEQARRADHKEVIVIAGGPGSGKSVIALSLMGELSRQGRTVLHATGSKAFTQTMRRVAGRGDKRVQSMFKYFNQFGAAERNGLDVLILDEAHRLRETSANRYTKAALRTGKPQVDELIDAARVPVFLLDEHQVVRPGEIGTTADIRAAADRLGLGTRVIELDGQFRCGGSRAYEQWVLQLLGLAEGGPVDWAGDPNFDVRLGETPTAMEQRLRGLLDDGYGARIAAGYTWKWSDPVPGGLVHDVRIGDWQRPWNNKREGAHAGAPGTSYWASDPAGFDQVGCVYTAQGFEYDYGGVIMGPDLVWRTDHWEARPEKSFDTQAKRGSDEEFDRAVRNTYKVLLTRGMRGVEIYSTDPETQELLRSLIDGGGGDGGAV